ncbi:hypothetical protein ACJ7VE_39075 [Streptomyces sp. PB17]|uniref:hypothetical protein n=1 Tax=Streptomyces sp. PB17 TaxID=3384158 RepID=UPI0038B55E1D
MTTAETVLWDVQVKRGNVWVTTVDGKDQTAEGNALALGALAAHLMTVDHVNDLDERRVLVKAAPDGLATRLRAMLTEDDLVQYLHERGYYLRCEEVPLAAVFPSSVHDALPLHLQCELNRVGTPRRRYAPGELA